MERYEYDYDENNYIDGEEKRPKLLLILGFLVLLIIVVVMIVSCTAKNKSSNANLSYIRVLDGTLSPMFSSITTSYTLNTTKDEVIISCTSESSKAKVDGCNSKVTTETTKQHSIKVTAEDGTVKTYNVLINKLEEVKEKISVKIVSDIESGKQIQSQIELRTELSDVLSNATYEWYKDNKKIDSVEDKIIASESGKYYVKVINDETKEESVSDIFIVNIKEKEIEETETQKEESSNKNNYTLVISKINGNSSNWTESVTLSVEVTTSNGLHSKAYSFDGGKTYQSSNTKKFTKNQTVNIVVRDIKGNTVSKSVKITKIDKTVPEVSISATNKTNKTVTLKAVVSPSTTASGYTYEWYKDGAKIKGATKNIYQVTQSGNYKVKVITGGGKSVVSKEYTFSVINITCPTISAASSQGYNVPAKTWFDEVIYVKITPSAETTNYDVYLNEYGKFDKISSDFTYVNTFTSTIKVKIVNNGLRMLKIVVRDQKGNNEICYSNVYYLK